MAAAAYGAMVSLMYVLDNLQHPSRQQLHFDKNQIQTLCEKVGFLLGFFEDYSEIVCHTDTEDLARRIAYAIDEAEEVIDCHVVDQLSQKYAYQVDGGLSSFREDLDIVLNKIKSLKKELMIVKDQERTVKQLQQRVSLPVASSSAPPPSEKFNSTMVGFDEHLVRVMNQLTRDEPTLQIVPIIGMGGLGSVWNPIEGEFLHLKKLVIFSNDLVHWNAEKHNFPKLEILELRQMNCLENIPSEIGEIDTLREIRLKSVTESVVQSAQEIIEEQQSYGNEHLQLILELTLLISKVFPKGGGLA